MNAIMDSVTIDAAPEVVWTVFTDVERWPEWTASVSRATIVRGAGVEPGARVRIRQPRLPTLTWQVSCVEPGAGWTWTARSPGVTTVAAHTLKPLAGGSTLVEQRIEQRGPLGALVGRLTRGLTRRYLALEGAGLKERCEAALRA